MLKPILITVFSVPVASMVAPASSVSGLLNLAVIALVIAIVMNICQFIRFRCVSREIRYDVQQRVTANELATKANQDYENIQKEYNQFKLQANAKIANLEDLKNLQSRAIELYQGDRSGYEKLITAKDEELFSLETELSSAKHAVEIYEKHIQSLPDHYRLKLMQELYQSSPVKQDSDPVVPSPVATDSSVVGSALAEQSPLQPSYDNLQTAGGTNV